jgi:hypothetical protein
MNEAWDKFALENGAHHLLSDKILSQSIWKFINDHTSVYIYQEILNKVRAGQDFSFNIRCDSPDRRRFLEIRIILQENGNVLFENRILKEESRTAEKILDCGILRSDEMLIICSWCNRLKTASDGWQEVELAVKSMGLFEENLYPTLSHGICPDCYRAMSKSLHNAS